MFSKSKSRLADLATVQQQLGSNAQSMQEQIDRNKEVLRARRAEKDQKNDEFMRLQAEITASKSETIALKNKMEETKAEGEKLHDELMDVVKSGEADRKAVEDAKTALQQMLEVEASLKAVHHELQMLASDEAKNAALDVAGGDLPTNIVPAPHKETSAQPGVDVDSEKLWLATNDFGADEVPEALRDALQSHAVLAALEKSLIVRAAELREGLRQWGFSQNATKQTKELCVVLQGSLKDGEEGFRKLQDDRRQLDKERDDHLAIHARVEAEHKNFQRTSDAVATQARDAIARAVSAEEQRNAAQKRLHDLQQSHKQSLAEHNDAVSEHEKIEQEKAQLHEETTRRTTAAKRLVERSTEQAQKAEKDLERAKQESESFKQAHSVLKEANAKLLQEKQSAQDTHEQLQDEHDALHTEIDCLSRHYMALLPAGFGGVSDPPVR